MFLKWMSDRKEIAIPMISRFPVLKNLYAVRFGRLVELVNSDTKHRRCIDIFVWLHGDSSIETIKRKLYKLMIFRR